MVKCPSCQATLLEGAARCQFCGATLAPVVPSRRAGVSEEPAISGQPSWVWPAYYGVAVWWIANGLYAILSRTVFAPASAHGSGIGMVGLVIGIVTMLVGIGLVLKVEAARGIVNVLCFLQILDGGLGVIIGFFLSGIVGLWGAIAMIVSALRIAFAVLMIFLLGETDTRAPNF